MDAGNIGVGNQGVITLSDTGEQLSGTVIAVANMEETLSGGQVVRYVTFQVENPGGLTENMSASVQVGDFLWCPGGNLQCNLRQDHGCRSGFQCGGRESPGQ